MSQSRDPPPRIAAALICHHSLCAGESHVSSFDNSFDIWESPKGYQPQKWKAKCQMMSIDFPTTTRDDEFV